MVDVKLTDGNSLTRAQALLAGIPGGFNQALKAAMSRTVSNVRSYAAEAITERYDISKASLRTEQNIRIRYAFGEGVTAYITYSGHKIPLYRYGGSSPKEPTVNKDHLDSVLINGFWKKAYPGISATGHQLKDHGVARFDHAFVARMKSGHIGIFERTGGTSASGGDAIQEIMGSSIPQMIGSPKVEEAISKHAAKKFDENLDAQINRLISGLW